MKRRNILNLGGGIMALVSFAPSMINATNGNGKKPNLLIIHTDEHNFRTLGCYRDTLDPKQAFIWGPGNIVETPNIDSIAKNGAICTNFYATSPVCTPSRAAFISGQYPQEVGAYRNNLPLNDNVVTFAEILKAKGYVTGYAGKWHLDGEGKPQWHPKRNFGFTDNRFMYNRGHWKKLEETADGPRVASRNKGKGNPNYNVAGGDDKSFTTDWLANKAVDFIIANKDKPFCFMISIPDPHGPDSVRAPYDKMYSSMRFKTPHTADKLLDNVPSWASPNRNKGNDAAYFGMVKCIDDNVGKIIKYLKKEGLFENTILVFTADHGDLRGEHGRQDKGVPLEASAKIPFVIQWPSKIKPGTRIDEVMSCIDFQPTILRMMGVNTSGKESGRDASGFFIGKAPEWEDVAILRKGQSKGWVCAVSKRYKLVLSPNDEPWLMDRLEDPDELVNCISKKECREVVRNLAKALKAYHKKYNDPSLRCPKMQYDLEWAVGNEPLYDQKNAPKAKDSGSKKKSRKR